MNTPANLNAFQPMKKGVTSITNSFYSIFNTLVTQNITRFLYSLNASGKNEMIYMTILVAIIVFSSILLYYASSSPTFLENRVYTYTALIVIPVLLFFYYTTRISSATASTILIGMAITTGIIALLLYAYTQMSSTASLLFNIIVTGVFGLIILIGLALAYNVFANYLNKQEGLIGFIIQFIFFLPCLFSDFIVWFFEQWNMTPNIVFVLFILEIAFLLLYMYLPKIMSAILENKAKTIILPGVVYLDKKNTIASTDTMMTIFKTPQPNPNYLLKAPTAFFNNFSISLWIYLNPQPYAPTKDSGNEKNAPFEYTIFDFNSSVCYNGLSDCSGGLPKITFMYDEANHGRETYNIYFTNNSNLNAPDDIAEHIHSPEYKYGKYKMYMTGQRWNHFVFTYNRNICDLYINGNLERSMDLTNCLPIIQPYIDEENNITSLQMTTGQADGVYGAVCNVEYYSNPLSNLEVITKYNLLMYSNPPVYNTGI